MTSVLNTDWNDVSEGTIKNGSSKRSREDQIVISRKAENICSINLCFIMRRTPLTLLSARFCMVSLKLSKNKKEGNDYFYFSRRKRLKNTNTSFHSPFSFEKTQMLVTTALFLKRII